MVEAAAGILYNVLYKEVFYMKKENFFKVVPKAMKHLLDMEQSLSQSSIDPKTKELIKIRASQINGCAYCLNMHTTDALKLGETAQRIFLLNAWEETDLFTPKEKVVLELTERLTLISDNRIDDDFYNEIVKYFTEEEFAYLVLMISQINTWNRINISINNDIDVNYK